MRHISPILIFLFVVGSCASQSAPPYWVEHWFEHNQNLSLVFSDADVAVYFDRDVNSSITWPFQYLGDVWRYTKNVYGSFSPEGRLYSIFHTAKYSGGHPSTYFDESHDFRDVIDCGSSSPQAWLTGQGNDLDIVTHEVAHIVEGASKGVHGSPAFPIWGDSKWAEIFNYDVYFHLNMGQDASRWFDLMVRSRDNFPRPDTYWFRDWFYPIWFGSGSQGLNRFFQLLAQHYPKNGESYARDMNWGEFVHFWSGAVGRNLKQLASGAFGWPDEWEMQFNNARQEFSSIRYD